MIDRQARLDRCDQEVAAMQAQPSTQPAWLVALGIADWEAERRLIENEEKTDASGVDR